MNATQFIQEVNSLRKTCKANTGSEWYVWTGEVYDKSVQLKGYRTWLQIFRVDGVRYAGLSDRSVSQFLADLSEPFQTSMNLNSTDGTSSASIG